MHQFTFSKKERKGHKSVAELPIKRPEKAENLMATIHPAHENFDMVFNVMLGIKKAVDGTTDLPNFEPTDKDFNLKSIHQIAPYRTD